MAAMQEGAGLGLEALSPTEVEKRVEDAACAKAALPTGRCFVSAMLAGAFVAFGGMFFCTFLSDATLPFAVQRLVGGVCFCLGLVLVLCCGAELFTGNVLMVCSRASGRVRWRAVLGNWGLVWLGNLAGSLAAMALVLLANVQGMNGGEVGATFVSVASAKASLGPVELFFKAVMCNVLVCLAVWIGFASRSVTDKVVGILLPIAAFVACGFEHCVANMFFLSTGILLNVLGGVGAAGAVSLGGAAANLVLATLGNVAGGVLVGLAYWYVYRGREAR